MSPQFCARLRVALLAGKRADVRGAAGTSLRRSDGYEFAELRGYVLGDDPRRIDWAATARAGALQTRVVLEDVGLVLAAALDASHSMFVGRTRTNYDVARAAATLWWGAGRDDDRCMRAGAVPLVLSGVRGRIAAAICARATDPAGTRLAAILQIALAAMPRGARLLVASDFFAADWNEPLRAAAARFDVTALVIGDPWRDGLPLAGFTRLRDAESGRVERVYVDARSRQRYREAVVRRERTVLGRLQALGIRSALLDPARAPETALAAALRFA